MSMGKELFFFLMVRAGSMQDAEASPATQGQVFGTLNDEGLKARSIDFSRGRRTHREFPQLDYYAQGAPKPILLQGEPH